jgi:hypothetical protein
VALPADQLRSLETDRDTRDSPGDAGQEPGLRRLACLSSSLLFVQPSHSSLLLDALPLPDCCDAITKAIARPRSCETLIAQSTSRRSVANRWASPSRARAGAPTWPTATSISRNPTPCISPVPRAFATASFTAQRVASRSTRPLASSCSRSVKHMLAIRPRVTTRARPKAAMSTRSTPHVSRACGWLVRVTAHHPRPALCSDQPTPADEPVRTSQLPT